MVRLGGAVLLAVALLALTAVIVHSASSSVRVERIPASGTLSKTAAATTPSSALENLQDTTVDGRRVWEDSPTVPYLPVTQEVAGVEIPREPSPKSDYVPGGAIPTDVGNPAAAGNEPPTTGGSVTIRFDSEPKSLNPITESSAVQTYISSYAVDYLAKQNPETFDFDPAIAERWIREDSVKLRSDFPGRERRMSLKGGPPVTSFKITVPKPPEPKEDETPKPKPIPVVTLDSQGKPVPKTWVGFFPVGTQADVEHRWSDDAGKLDASNLPAGTYEAKTGVELYGKLNDADDGYELDPLADESAESLKLAKGDVIDVQRESVITFYLRDDVTWSDGEPFTSADLEFAHAVINNPLVDGDSVRVYYADVVDVEPLETHVVQMKYRKQYFQAFDYTAALSIYTPPKHLFENFFREQGKTLVMERLTPQEEKRSKEVSVHGQQFAKFFNQEERYNSRPMGMGPYIIERWDRNARVVLRRRDDYWDDAHAGHLDRIVVRFITDNTTAMQALRAGEIDFFYRVTPEQFYDELGGPPDWIKKKYVKAEWFYPTYSYAGWNLRRPLFSDPRVRMALAMLTDKKTFLETKLYGSGVLVSGSQYYFSRMYDPAVRSIAYDPDAALDLLAEAGWIDTDGDGLLDKDGQSFAFTMLIPSGTAISEQFSEMMQYNLRRVGIRMDVLALEWASFVERLLNRDFDVVVLSWAMELESDPFQIFHGSQAAPESRSSNHVGFKNALADELISRIRLAIDDDERQRLNFTFHRLLDAQQPYTFLWTRKEFGVYHQRYRGVKFYPLRPGFDLREWYVPNELQ